MKLRILINEDTPSDGDLLEHAIRKAGFDFTARRVETRDDFLSALQEFMPDVIISDYRLPTFDGMQALELANEHVPLIPFIIVTGSMNEETAVECMKAGADDYVLKDHIVRIGPAIGAAMARKRALWEKIVTEQSLASSERKFRTIFENANDAILLLDDILIVDCNPMAERVFGCPREAIVGRPPYDFSPDFQKDGTSSRDLATQRIRKTLEGFSQYFEWRHLNSDGTPFDVDIGLSLVHIDDKPLVVAVLRDITEKKRAETELRESEKKFQILSQEFNALLDAIPDTILLQSRDLEIIWANKAALLSFGGRDLENGDRHCYRLVH